VFDFHAELSLLSFVLLNTAVFGSAWFFASRRMTASRSQAVLDTALIGYAVQYAAVGLPGIIHCLSATAIYLTAAVFSAGLLIAGLKSPANTNRSIEPAPTRSVKLLVLGTAFFAGSMILVYAYTQSNLPVISNDAMTYQFPAAVQWLQQGRISLFQTWFFNPANTYSPLAGSIFVAWMIAPFGNDVVARFVEVPALFCVGIALYRLCRELTAQPAISALVSAAAILARPIFLPSMMGKDDLFVAFFFITSLVALSKQRSAERYGAIRFGIALGLLLATKYTALLSAVVLMLAFPSPRWGWRGWGTSLTVVLLLAGPWYLRNCLATCNPIFPMFSLFTSARSQAFGSWAGSLFVIAGSNYGMPVLMAAVLQIGWIFSMPWRLRDAIARTCGIGVPLGLALFFLASPFAEVRFVLPIFLLLFASCAIAIERGIKKRAAAITAGILLLSLSVCMVFTPGFLMVALEFAAVALLIALFGLLAIWWADGERLRLQAVVSTGVGMLAVYGYIHWFASCRDYQQTMFDDETGYAMKYPELNPLWRFVNENIPGNATVAYTNLYLIYPLQADAMGRRLTYAPTKAGVASIADLGWLGSHLSGEKLVLATNRATVADADRAVWLSNLTRTGAGFLIVGKGGLLGVPPEAQFAKSDPKHFQLIFDGVGGWVYQIKGMSL
jgi:hypothetical protein